MAIGRFVGEFMVERTLKDRAPIEEDSDEDEEEVQDQRRGRGRITDGTNGARKKKGRRVDPEEEKEKMLETMMKGIGRAVGGKLSDVK